nr:MAG: hypothetical protein [Microviridae sp.]
MENLNVNAKALKQDNLFEEGKCKYYIQFAKGKKMFAINVGETTYNKLIDLLVEESKEIVKNEKAKLDK